MSENHCFWLPHLNNQNGVYNCTVHSKVIPVLAFTSLLVGNVASRRAAPHVSRSAVTEPRVYSRHFSYPKTASSFHPSITNYQPLNEKFLAIN